MSTKCMHTECVRILEGVTVSGFYDQNFQVKTTAGDTVNLADFSGKVLLVVNTASKCGFTPQFEGLEKLYQDYRHRGFYIIGFPCNQFAHQDPGSNHDISEFCRLNYGVSFPMMAKIDVNGENACPVFTYLKNQQKGVFSSKIKWNFTKFLIGRDGTVLKRYAPITTPDKIAADIDTALGHSTED